MICEPVLDGVADELRGGLEVELPQNATAIGAHGLLAEAERLRNLLGGSAGPELSQDCELAGRQRRVGGGAPTEVRRQLLGHRREIGRAHV